MFTGIAACGQNKMKQKTTGSIERLDPQLDNIISTDAKAEIIAEGFDWSEGPCWAEAEKMLLFSDVPANTIYKWTEAKGKEIYLEASGYTGSSPRTGEMGSNGLLLDKEGNLVLCQHGNRQMVRMNAALKDPKPIFTTLAANYEGKRFNSPNDAAYNHTGELFFTDPPYGLEKQMNDPQKEIPFQGVYRVATGGQVFLVTDSLTRPNGIAFFHGEDRFIVANSDPAKPDWFLFEKDSSGAGWTSKIFYSAAGYDKSLKGLPDGLKIDNRGNVYASGPGGIYFFNRDGKLLGKLKLEEAASNVALSGDEKTLYITNDMYVLRLKMK